MSNLTTLPPEVEKAALDVMAKFLRPDEYTGELSSLDRAMVLAALNADRAAERERVEKLVGAAEKFARHEDDVVFVDTESETAFHVFRAALAKFEGDER